MSRKFQRRIEDFTCGHCHAHVVGNGYTNHCPQCLYSRHVDIHPGDRDNPCGGLMEPIDILQTSSGFTITHQCQKCGETRSCKSAESDNPDNILEIVRKIAREKF